MKLEQLEYSEHVDKPQEWRTVNCTFGDINLIVGRNASGKTRTLNLIKTLAELLTERDAKGLGEGNYDVIFTDNGTTTSYEIRHHEGKVAYENLVIDNKTLIKRERDGIGEILAAERNEMMRFQISPDKVATTARRDLIQHPFLEDLLKWGENLLKYDFGKSLGQETYSLIGEGQGDRFPSLRQTQMVVAIFVRGNKEYPNVFKNSIIKDMTGVGYDVVGIDVEPFTDYKATIPIASPPLGIVLKESDLQAKTRQYSISQGMFRALSVIIQINYAIFSGSPSCILIDDIGEGLDFERSSALVQLMIDKAKKSSVQLIMTTNDRFVMNKVPLEYWIVLERDGGKSIHHNYRNSKELFDEFELTGLSNFDMFSSNYYLKNNSKE